NEHLHRLRAMPRPGPVQASSRSSCWFSESLEPLPDTYGAPGIEIPDLALSAPLDTASHRRILRDGHAAGLQEFVECIMQISARCNAAARARFVVSATIDELAIRIKGEEVRRARGTVSTRHLLGFVE